MLASSSAQKPIRKLALARITSSPVLKRQYWLARGGWRYYALWIAASVGIVLIPVLLMVVPAMGGWQLTECRDRASGLASITLAAFATGVVGLLHGSWLRRELTRSTSVALLGQLPISDLQYLRNRSIMAIGTTLIFLVVSLSYVAGILMSQQLTTAEISSLIGLAIVEWLVVASLTILLPVWAPQLARPEVVGGVFVVTIAFAFGGTVAWMVGALQLPALEAVLDLLLVVTPTGWPLLMMLDGVLNPRPGIWWMAVPTGITVLAAAASYVWLERRYVIGEIQIENGQLGLAIGEKDWQLIQTQDEADTPTPFEQVLRRLRLLTPREDGAELSVAEATDRVRTANFLERDQWLSAGFVERLVASLLTERERQVADVLTGGRPAWTKSLMISTTTALGMLGVVLLIDQALQMRLIAMGGHFAFFGLMATLSGTWRGAIWKASNGHMCASMALLPISHAEAERLAIVLGAVRGLCLLPFAIGMTVLITFGLTGRPEFVMSTYIAAKAVLTFVALHQWWFIPVQLNVASPFPSWAWFTDLLVGGVCVVLCLAGAAGLFIAGQSEIWCLVASGVLFGSGWIAQRFQRHRIQNTPTDFVGPQTGAFRLEQQLRSR